MRPPAAARSGWTGPIRGGCDGKAGWSPAERPVVRRRLPRRRQPSRKSVHVVKTGRREKSRRTPPKLQQSLNRGLGAARCRAGCRRRPPAERAPPGGGETARRDRHCGARTGCRRGVREMSSERFLRRTAGDKERPKRRDRWLGCVDRASPGGQASRPSRSRQFCRQRPAEATPVSADRGHSPANITKMSRTAARRAAYT